VVADTSVSIALADGVVRTQLSAVLTPLVNDLVDIQSLAPLALMWRRMLFGYFVWLLMLVVICGALVHAASGFDMSLKNWYIAGAMLLATTLSVQLGVTVWYVKARSLALTSKLIKSVESALWGLCERPDVVEMLGDMFDSAVDETCRQLSPWDNQVRSLYKDLDGRHAFVSWLTAKYNGPPGSGDATCGRELVRAGLKNLTAKGGMKRAMAWLVRQAPVYDSVPPKPSKSPTPMRRAFRAIAPAPAPDTLPPASAVKGGPAASVPEGRSESWFDSAGKLIAESLGGARRDEAATTLQAVARGRTTRHRGASVGKAEDGLGVAQPTVKPAQAVDIDLDHNDGLSAFARARKMFSA